MCIFLEIYSAYVVLDNFERPEMGRFSALYSCVCLVAGHVFHFVILHDMLEGVQLKQNAC